MLKEEIEQQTKDFQTGFAQHSYKAMMNDETVDPSVQQNTAGRMIARNNDQIEATDKFDVSLLDVQRMLEKLEKQWLNQEGDGDEAALWYLGDNMTHAYYLD